MSVLKDATGKDSAGRVVCIGLAVVVGFRLFWLTFMGVALGVPDAIIVIVAFFSMPIYKKFEAEGGAALIDKLLDKLGTGAAGVNATGDVVAQARDMVTAFIHRHDPEK